MYEIFIEILIAFCIVVFIFILSLDISSILRKRKKEPEYSEYKGKTLIMVPCKGKDITMYENLISLKKQSYKNYKVVAIIDSEEDPSRAFIKKVGFNYIITDQNQNGSGKVKAISTALKKFRDFDAYVIADSDVFFERTWLTNLLAPLTDKKVGVSTMYPFFKPIRKNFWSEMKMIWGFVGDSLLENEKRRFGWGGSLAFRKDLLDKKSLSFFTDSKYSVSDDISLTKIAKSKNLNISYTKTPKPIVNCDENFGVFFEWTNRQTALTLLGYRKNLYEGLVYYSSEIILILSGIFLSIFISPIFLIFFIHTFKSIAIAYKRSRLNDLKILIIVILAPFFYEVNLIVASRMKSIVWRGNKYKL